MTTSGSLLGRDIRARIARNRLCGIPEICLNLSINPVLLRRNQVLFLNQQTTARPCALQCTASAASLFGASARQKTSPVSSLNQYLWYFTSYSSWVSTSFLWASVTSSVVKPSTLLWWSMNSGIAPNLLRGPLHRMLGRGADRSALGPGTRILFTGLALCYRASCCRYLWTKAIAMLPSPTAWATRLTGLNLTSPQANTPGRLDSSR